MLDRIVESKHLRRLYSEVDYALDEFYIDNGTINNFIEIARSIETLLTYENIKYRNFSISGEPSQHAVNVAILNAQLGMCYNTGCIFDLILGGLVHDIGKLYISSDILNKPGPLTNEERIEMAKHTDIGYNLLKNKIDNDNVMSIVRDHHKVINSLNNHIYIDEIKDNKEKVLPLICGISDITDAMLSYRVYKKPLSIQETKDEFRNKGIKDTEQLFRIIL